MQHFVAKTHAENVLWFKEHAKIAHAAAVKKGFYDDAPPIGTLAKNLDLEHLYKISNLISSEIGEAYECYRTGKIKPNDAIFDTVRALMDKDKVAFIAAYADHVKGTVSEELADVVIRAMDFAGSVYKEIECEEYSRSEAATPNLRFHQLFRDASDIGWSWVCALKRPYLVATSCIHIAKFFDIDIYANVAMKMAYNEHRPYKHGKNF